MYPPLEVTTVVDDEGVVVVLVVVVLVVAVLVLVLVVVVGVGAAAPGARAGYVVVVGGAAGLETVVLGGAASRARLATNKPAARPTATTAAIVPVNILDRTATMMVGNGRRRQTPASASEPGQTSPVKAGRKNRQ